MKLYHFNKQGGGRFLFKEYYQVFIFESRSINGIEKTERIVTTIYVSCIPIKSLERPIRRVVIEVIAKFIVI